MKLAKLGKKTTFCCIIYGLEFYLYVNAPHNKEQVTNQWKTLHKFSAFWLLYLLALMIFNFQDLQSCSYVFFNNTLEFFEA